LKKRELPLKIKRLSRYSRFFGDAFGKGVELISDAIN